MCVGKVGVFPAEIEDPPIIEKTRIPVVFLIDRQLSGGTVMFQALHIGDVRAPIPTRHTHEWGDGSEDDSIVRQVTGVVIVNIGFPNQREFTDLTNTQLSVIEHQGQLEDLKAIEGAWHGHKESAGIEMDVNLADVAATGWLEEHLGGCVPPTKRHNTQPIVITGFGKT